MAINITDTARKKVISILRQRQTPDDILRIGLNGGGCSGFQYYYEFTTSTDERDKIFEFNGLTICIDKKSYLFLRGLEIDYEEDLMKSGLVFRAPQATRSCGCGESISF